MADNKNWIKYVRYINLAFSLGISMVLVMLLGIYGGIWLDRRLGTSPAFLLLGTFLAVGAGFYNLWSELSKLSEASKKKKVEEKKRHVRIAKNSRIKAGKNEK